MQFCHTRAKEGIGAVLSVAMQGVIRSVHSQTLNCTMQSIIECDASRYAPQDGTTWQRKDEETALTVGSRRCTAANGSVIQRLCLHPLASGEWRTMRADQTRVRWANHDMMHTICERTPPEGTMPAGIRDSESWEDENPANHMRGTGEG